MLSLLYLCNYKSLYGTMATVAHMWHVGCFHSNDHAWHVHADPQHLPRPTITATDRTPINPLVPCNHGSCAQNPITTAIISALTSNGGNPFRLTRSVTATYTQMWRRLHAKLLCV